MYSSVLLSREDINRIKNDIVPIYNEGDIRHSVDMNLRSLSQAKIKSWPNLIEIGNKNHLNKLKQQFLAKEEIKRKIDEEEKKYFDIQKNRIADKAQEVLFYSQDSVKSFLSKMLFCDILGERKVQLNNKKAKERRMKQYDSYWDAIEKKKMIENDMKELSKIEVERKKNEAELEIINQQFSESKIKQVQNMQEKFIEGQIIKRNALKAMEEEIQKEMLKKKQSQKQNEEFLKANEEIEKQKEEKKKVDKEEEKKKEEYAKRKQQLTDLRKKKEIEKAKEKQDQRQKLIDKQIENLTQIKSKEDLIITQHIEKTEKKKADKEREKKANYVKIQNEIIEDRIMHMQRIKDCKEKERQECILKAEEWSKEFKQMEEEDRKKYLLTRQKQKELAEYQLKQAKEKKEQAIGQFISIQEDSFYNKNKIKYEQDNFISFAEEQIKKYDQKNKEIFPLLLELKNYKKKNYLA